MEQQAFNALIDELYAVLTDDQAFGKVAIRATLDRVIYIKEQFAGLIQSFGVETETSASVNYALFYGSSWRSLFDQVFGWYCGLCNVEKVYRPGCKSFQEAYASVKMERLMQCVGHAND